MDCMATEAKETDIRNLNGKAHELRSILTGFENDFERLQNEVFFIGEKEACPKDLCEKSPNKIVEVSDVLDECAKIQSRIRDIYTKFNNLLG